MNNNLRVPPQNIEAERAVLGSVLIDDEAFNKVADLLEPKYFYDPRNEIIFEHLYKLFSSSKALDVLTLSAELKKSNKHKEAGGNSYISDLINSVPTSANIEEYANLVKEAAVRRNLISFGAKLDESARNEELELDQVIDDMEKDLLLVSQKTIAKDFFDAETLLEMQMKKADEFAKNPNALRGFPTGISSFDNLLGGLHRSDLIIIAARPSVGKSAFGFDIVRHISVVEKKNIVIFSLEMPAIQVIERLLAQQTEISLWKLRMGGMNNDEYKRFNLGQAKLADSNIFVDETPGISIMQLRSKARKLMMDKKIDLILIDYLQLMQGNPKYADSRAQEVGEISRSLKILARELNVPIIALSQLNRAVENRQDRIPQLSDLRESGSIEQDADLVIFLSRDMSQEEDVLNQKSKLVDISVAKHRNGPTGKLVLKFVGEFQKFYDEK